MKSWMWHKYYVAMAAGLAAALSSTLVHRGAGMPMLVMAGLGLVMTLFAFLGLFGLLEPKFGPSGWPVALFGILLFLAPWVLGYTAHAGQAWTSWVCGVVGVAVGVWGVVSDRRVPAPPRTMPRSSIRHEHASLV